MYVCKNNTEGIMGESHTNLKPKILLQDLTLTVLPDHSIHPALANVPTCPACHPRPRSPHWNTHSGPTLANAAVVPHNKHRHPCCNYNYHFDTKTAIKDKAAVTAEDIASAEAYVTAAEASRTVVAEPP